MLDIAIAALEAELADLGVGKKFPTDGSADWFLAHAKALGLAQLRRMKQMGVENSHSSVRNMYKKALIATKGVEDVEELDVPT